MRAARSVALVGRGARVVSPPVCHTRHVWGALAGVVAMVVAISSSVTGVALPARPPRDPGLLAVDLTTAQQVIDDPSSSPAELQGAGRFQQLATVALAVAPTGTQRAVLARLSGRAAASLRTDLGASGALHRLTVPRRSLPPWKIVAPPPPAMLLGYFRSAQARFGVPWQYLAAIEMIETDFGRVVGLSTAGAEGPMQFMPSTWAAYGIGNVHSPRDAILGAAHYLTANGAPGDMAGAIYHYNPSTDYVTAVRDYAARMMADPRAFYGYYYWQVILARSGSLVVLPIGFPKERPVPLPRAGG